MSAAFTFGSLGDIITISQLALQLARALDDARGSVGEYQALRKDLDTFAQILVQVDALRSHTIDEVMLTECPTGPCYLRDVRLFHLASRY